MSDTNAPRVLDARWDGYDAFKVEEAGQILRTSRGKAYEMAKSGDLPTIKVGRLLRVPRAALERMLAG
jgi:excisionase family DNA binding protein